MNTQMSVSNYMTRAPVTVSESTSLSEAFKLIDSNHFRHLPVLNNDGQLSGMVSQRDLSNLCTAMEIYSGLEEEYQGAEKLKVGDIMTPKPFTVTTEFTVEEAAEMMVQKRVGALPVLSAGTKHQLEGIISYVDVLKGLLGQTLLVEAKAK